MKSGYSFLLFISAAAIGATISLQAAPSLSPFASSVKGITVPNAHLVAKGRGVLVRGSAPLGRARELVQAGITDVVIFKEETRGEVSREINELRQAGIRPAAIKFIPFRWKQFESFESACAQTVDALQVLVAVHASPGRAAYFHCTHGEDRTGYLAALTRMLLEGASSRKVFEAEMCEHGYEAGNPRKPPFVVQAIRGELTPIFLRMAALIESGKLRLDRLDPAVCQSAPQASPARLPVCRASSLAIQ